MKKSTVDVRSALSVVGCKYHAPVDSLYQVGRHSAVVGLLFMYLQIQRRVRGYE